jgi:hypothetical protein
MRWPVLTNGFRRESAQDISASIQGGEKKCQLACKPGFVPPPCEGGSDHSSGAPVARRFAQPTRAAGPEKPEAETSRHPYSVLLPVGFALPPPLPAARCALTAPFHPYPLGTQSMRRAVRSLWHFPWGHPRRTLSGTVFPWSPDFPPLRPFGTSNSGHPANWLAGVRALARDRQPLRKLCLNCCKTGPCLRSLGGHHERP